MSRMQAVVDNCPERMHAADAEGPRPPRIETVVEFCSGMGVETAVRMQVVDTCPEKMQRMYAEAVLTVRRCCWCKKRNRKKQEAAGEC